MISEAYFESAVALWTLLTHRDGGLRRLLCLLEGENSSHVQLLAEIHYPACLYI